MRGGRGGGRVGERGKGDSGVVGWTGREAGGDGESVCGGAEGGVEGRWGEEAGEGREEEESGKG